MVDPRDILRYTDEIARRFQPRKIILFGSYAYGEPSADSDVDLLVVMPYRGESYREAAKIDETVDAVVNRSFPLDLLVRSPSGISRRVRMGDSFLIEVLNEGIVIYDSDRRGVGRQGRRRLQRRTRYATLQKGRA